MYTLTYQGRVIIMFKQLQLLEHVCVHDSHSKCPWLTLVVCVHKVIERTIHNRRQTHEEQLEHKIKSCHLKCVRKEKLHS